MKQERLGSPKDFADQLAIHLAGFADPAVPLPAPAQLAALVDATFYASLHEEEARRVEFSIAWQPVAHDCAAVVAITPPVLATPRNLTKLAPATWREATSIAVRPDGGDLVAWALLERNASGHQPFTIRASASGVLRVDYAGEPRALYARGEILLIGGDHRVKSPARVLTRTFPAWRGADLDLRAVIITRIALRALAHGHGGMILVIPAELETPLGVRIHYGVGEGANVLVNRYADVVRDLPPAERSERLRGSRQRGMDGRVPVRDETQIAFSEAIELVARLTAIDNALLLDTDLRVRGFGVQVIEGDAPQMTFEHSNPYSEDIHVDDLSTFKGTRHPAGVIFCMRQATEAAAIIASQDGHLTLAAKDAGGVVEVLGSYERAFGWV
ncbi:MAG: putative sensor domain DACNV-containing protein [Kofleriaceae bacterium]